MKASDVMISPVVTTSPNASIKDVAKIFLDRHISAVPVVNDKGEIVGIISEGDLLHRAEAGTERRRGWWLRALATTEDLAAEYVKAHTRKVSDAMTRNVVTASPDTPLHEVAALLEKHAIKRVPIVRQGQLVGIVSRANLVQALASASKALDIPLSDAAIRDRLMAHLTAQPWAHTDFLNVTVNDGVVTLWGATRSDAERKAIRVAAETTPGVRAVDDNLSKWPAGATI